MSICYSGVSIWRKYVNQPALLSSWLPMRREGSTATEPWQVLCITLQCRFAHDGQSGRQCRAQEKFNLWYKQSDSHWQGSTRGWRFSESWCSGVWQLIQVTLPIWDRSENISVYIYIYQPLKGIWVRDIIIILDDFLSILRFFWPIYNIWCFP